MIKSKKIIRVYKDFTQTKKVCEGCDKLLNIKEFPVRNDNWSYRPKCKVCMAKQKNEYYHTNKEEINKKLKENATPEQRAAAVERVRQWRLNNPEKAQKLKKEEIERAKERRHNDAEYNRKINDNGKRWRKNNPENVRKYKRKWRENNKDNVYLKISDGLRARLRVAIRNDFKTGSAVQDLGCSIEEFKLYLEMLFYPHPETGEMMTWENYGKYGWHIDHIIPLSAFDLENREQFLQACYYKNLQPMWAEENLKKGSTIPVEE